jgi:adenylate cyclase
MSETRKLAAILVSDVVGYSRLAGADEDRILARLRTLRSDLIDPTIAVHHGRIVKRTGDGAIVEFRSVVDAVRCAIEVQNGLIERNAGVSEERRIEYRVGIHLGDVVEESDGDLMGDGVNIAARLEGVAKPGAICLSEQAYWQVKGRLDLKVSDLGLVPLKNIAEPVRVYSLEVGQPAEAKPALAATAAVKQESVAPAPRTGGWSSRWPALAAAIAALLILVAAGGWYTLGDRLMKPAQAAHLSVVVLPFTNLSGDPSQEYFADGVTENLTTALSRIHGSFVIARNTAFTYKGKSIDAKEIGKELGVRYLLEGSVQRDQNRVRVNAQLVDAASGAHLWADQFDEDVADLFKLQDHVVARLASSLGYALINAEAEKGARSKNPDTVDLTMRGWTLVWRGASQPFKERRETNGQARALFDRALQIDPNDADALVGSAETYVAEYIGGWGDPGTDYAAKVLGQADRAIALDINNVSAYCWKSWYLGQVARQYDEALRVADAGLAINPNYLPLYMPRAVAENSLGRYGEAKADAERAMRLSPRDPEMGFLHVIVGNAEINLGHFDAAIDAYRKAIDSGFRTFFAYSNLSAAYALAGKMDEAKTALAEARRLNPAITVKWMKEHAPNLPAVFDGVRKAGLPEE